MNTTEILSKIKTLLGVEAEEVKLAQMKLVDGLTIVESESFKAEDSIVIITEDGKVPLPEGDYELEDGRLLVVKEEGVIFEVKEGEAKEEEKEEEVVEEEAKEEEEYMEKETASPKKIVETISKESFFSEIEKLKEENESLKKELEDVKLKSVEKTEETKEELTEEKTEETKEVELSVEEEVTPIVHNPENKKETEGFRFSANRNETTLDRVMKRLSK
jgi:DNA polymerase III gamma/tau subunit